MAWLATAVVLAHCLGCDSSPYDVAPVRGNVSVDGNPMARATIMFSPVPASRGDEAPPGKSAVGVINDDGSYVLRTFGKKDGAIVGEHWVTLYRMKSPDADLPKPSKAMFVPEFDRLLVPHGKVKVTAGEDNEIDIDLSKEEVRRFGEKEN